MSSTAIPFQVRQKFMEHYSRCSDILNASDAKMTPQLSLELYSVMYVISDYAAFGYKHNRELVSEALLSKIISTLSTTHPQFTSDMFRKRILFYSQVVGGLELHAHALAGRDVSEAHPVLRCDIAFSDCCLYPSYIEDYNAPRPMLSALDVFDFSISVMEPLNTEFTSLYNDICDICALPAPIQASNVGSPVESSVPIYSGDSHSSEAGECGIIVFLIVLLVILVIILVLVIAIPSIS